MQDADPSALPLQNHFPLDKHFTTEAGVWMPQYLHGGAIAGVTGKSYI